MNFLFPIPANLTWRLEMNEKSQWEVAAWMILNTCSDTYTDTDTKTTAEANTESIKTLLPVATLSTVLE